MRFYDILRLDEALNFVDQTPIKDFLTAYAGKVESPEGKAWMTSKSVMRALSDREDSASKLDPSKVDTATAPAWLQTAIDRGDDLYEFNPSETLEQHLDHIVDWLNGISGEGAPDKSDPNFTEKNIFYIQNQKDLKGLSKFNVDMAFEKANTWVEEMNKVNAKTAASQQSANMENDPNFKVIKRFDNGCVAVSLITQQALQDEGNKMSHCVGGHGYWKKVEAGTVQIYSIRTPQGESATTIEINQGRVNQVKGKSNRAPAPKYIDMAVELLNQIKAKGECGDLKSAGVMFDTKKERYGTFSDMADLILEKGPIQIYQAGEYIQMLSTKIGMITQKMGDAYRGSWSYNTDLTSQELKAYSTAVRSLINKYAPIHSKPDQSLEKVLDAFNLLFDPKDNQVKAFDPELMTHLMTTTNGIEVMRRGDQYFVGKDDSMIKLTPDRNLRWMQKDIYEMFEQIEGMASTFDGYGQAVLKSFGLNKSRGEDVYLPTLKKVYHTAGDIQVGISGNLYSDYQGNQANTFAVFEKGLPVAWYVNGGLSSIQYGDTPIRANQMDAIADAVKSGEMPGNVKNRLIATLTEQGYDGLEYDDDLDIGYPLGKKTPVGNVIVEPTMNKSGRSSINYLFDINGTSYKMSTDILDNNTNTFFQIMPYMTALPDEDTSRNLLRALQATKMKWNKPSADDRKLFKSVGLEFNPKTLAFAMDNSLRAKVVYRNGPVTVQAASKIVGRDAKMIFSVMSSEDVVAEIQAQQMSNGVRISSIEYHDDMEGPEAVADFINDKGKELKIFPPRAEKPEEALLAYGLLIRNGQVEVQQGGIDRLALSWKNGSVDMSDVVDGAVATRARKHGEKTNWIIRGADKGVLADISLYGHHVERMSTNSHAVHGKKAAMRLVRRFMEILDHVTEEEEGQ